MLPGDLSEGRMPLATTVKSLASSQRSASACSTSKPIVAFKNDSFNHPCSYVFREDPFRTRNQGGAWSSCRAATMNSVTNWLCRSAQDRSGSSQTFCTAPHYDGRLGDTCQWMQVLLKKKLSIQLKLFDFGHFPKNI